METKETLKEKVSRGLCECRRVLEDYIAGRGASWDQVRTMTDITMNDIKRSMRPMIENIEPIDMIRNPPGEWKCFSTLSDVQVLVQEFENEHDALEHLFRAIDYLNE